MTPDELRQRIATAFVSGDPECNHSTLDNIYEDVLKVIADCEGGHYGELAKLALEAGDKVPTRWYA